MAIPFFVRKLMASVEVKLVLSAFSEEMRHLKNGPEQNIGKSIAIEIITPNVIDEILGWAKQISGDIHKGRPPRVIALYLMMNVVRDNLASGMFHIYRGRLSMQGEALKWMNAYCLDELTKLGQMTADEKIAARKATNEDIGAVG